MLFEPCGSGAGGLSQPRICTDLQGLEYFPGAALKKHPPNHLLKQTIHLIWWLDSFEMSLIFALIQYNYSFCTQKTSYGQYIQRYRTPRAGPRTPETGSVMRLAAGCARNGIMSLLPLQKSTSNTDQSENFERHESQKVRMVVSFGPIWSPLLVVLRDNIRPLWPRFCSNRIHSSNWRISTCSVTRILDKSPVCWCLLAALREASQEGGGVSHRLHGEGKHAKPVLSHNL